MGIVLLAVAVASVIAVYVGDWSNKSENNISAPNLMAVKPPKNFKGSYSYVKNLATYRYIELLVVFSLVDWENSFYKLIVLGKQIKGIANVVETQL